MRISAYNFGALGRRVRIQWQRCSLYRTWWGDVGGRGECRRAVVQPGSQREADNLASRDITCVALSGFERCSHSAQYRGKLSRAIWSVNGLDLAGCDVFSKRPPLGRTGRTAGLQSTGPSSIGDGSRVTNERLEDRGFVASRVGSESRRVVRSGLDSPRGLLAAVWGGGQSSSRQLVVFRKKRRTFRSSANLRSQHRGSGNVHLPRLGIQFRTRRNARRDGFRGWTFRRTPSEIRSRCAILSKRGQRNRCRPGTSVRSLALRLFVHLPCRSDRFGRYSSIQSRLRGQIDYVNQNRCLCDARRHHAADTVRILP